MSDEDQEAWWRSTRGLAVATLGGAALAAFLIFVLARVAGEETLLALPFDYALAAAIVPLLLLLLVFWYARRQGDLDRQHHMGDD